MAEEPVILAADGRRFAVTALEYPLPAVDQADLIRLWREEWTSTDYDWLKALNGDYSDTLAIVSVLVRDGDRAVASASVAFPSVDAEVCVIGNVVTHPDYRRQGLAAALTDAAVGRAFAAGCEVAYLGGTTDPHNVYLRLGFRHLNGGVMRRAAVDGDRPEERFFAAGQAVSVRPATWGDLPGMSCFAAQPWSMMVLDYPRGLISGRYIQLERCVSNFPAVYDEVEGRGGAMGVMVGDKAHRILGFGSVTPEPRPARRHRAMLEVGIQDGYDPSPLLDLLIDGARTRGVGHLQAMVSARDDAKRGWFEALGLRTVVVLPDLLRTREGPVDVHLMEGRVNP